MRKKYILEWFSILAIAWAFGAWISFGKVYVRRNFFGVPPIQEATRTQTQFMAILLPRISSWPHKYTMSSSELREFLGSLKAVGYTSIGIDDVIKFYSQGRKLPPKALLITFAQNDFRGIEAADRVMESLRLRGVAFISRIATLGIADQGRFLTGHAVDQMRRSGAWNFGRIQQDGTQIVLEAGKIHTPLRFKISEMGLNDKNDNPKALNALLIHPNHNVTENFHIVQNSWPRTSEFSENFSVSGLRTDWVVGWGIVSVKNRQLEILPTPRQSGAGIFLRGTKNWRDQALEFELNGYRKEFWTYARYQDDDRFVRIGAHNGYWYLEQKIGPKNLPSMLARSPIQPGDLPARVRLVLKKEFAIVHVNGRMQFGRAMRISPAINRGQILIGVYGKQSGSAFATLTSVHARPLGEEWISFKSDVAAGLDKEHLKRLREEAVYASVMSPLWVKVAGNGKVSLIESQGLLIRSLAGFYGCRLIPMADFPKLGASVPESPALINKLISDLTVATKDLGAAGLNLRLHGGKARLRNTLYFLKKLHSAFHTQGWELWVTINERSAFDSSMSKAVDGILKPSQKTKVDLAVLKIIQRPSRKRLEPQTPASMQTASLTHMELILNR